MNKLYKDCPECGGNKIIEHDDKNFSPCHCSYCNGTGKVLNVEFIKWMVDLAEGFGLDGYGEILFLPEGRMMKLQFLTGEDKIIFPLLLQRAIEGVNKYFYTSTGAYKILPCSNDKYEVYDMYSHLQDSWTDDTIDTAKIEALFYVREETK
jgi:hypothetical protein